MKTAARLALVAVGLVFVLSFVGCPKKCVKTGEEEPVIVPEEPEPVPEPAPKVTLNLQTIHFDFDKSDIRSGDATILQGNADQLEAAKDAGQSPAVTIEGYCDPVGTSEYNMALGQRRAESAKAYLLKLGLDPAMFSTISYGEERLVTQDQAQFEQNRRCEFKPAQ
jgi:peptidoglycan-associated lipoprotein